MKKANFVLVIVLLAGCSTVKVAVVQQNSGCANKDNITFKINLDDKHSQQKLSGRMIVLMSSQLARSGELIPFFGSHSRSVWLTAKEVDSLSSRSSITIAPLGRVFPDDFCHAPKAKYYFKAILDVDHNYAYNPVITNGDWSSEVKTATITPASAGELELTLNKRHNKSALKLPTNVELFEQKSPSVSQFLKQDTYFRSLVLLPPNYHKSDLTYPVVFSFHSFGVTADNLVGNEITILSQGMKSGKLPEMIWVFPLYKTKLGIHEFVDSRNNGPWATSLLTEILPQLEAHYKMDARPEGRLLTGHSSGGWAALWLQVNYPQTFGGSWAIAPDPVDFRNFVNIDLTQRPGQNFYSHKDGSLRNGWKSSNGKGQSWKDLAQQEKIFGEFGGQIATFEAAFSPRNNSGKPAQLFDRDSGEIDTNVADYWVENFDIARLLEKNWRNIGARLNDKIHIIVGDEDNLYLNESVWLLDQTISALNGTAEFEYIKERDHFDVMDEKLSRRIIKQMYRSARPLVEVRSE